MIRGVVGLAWGRRARSSFGRRSFLSCTFCVGGAGTSLGVGRAGALRGRSYTTGDPATCTRARRGRGGGAAARRYRTGCIQYRLRGPRRRARCAHATRGTHIRAPATGARVPRGPAGRRSRSRERVFKIDDMKLQPRAARRALPSVRIRKVFSPLPRQYHAAYIKAWIIVTRRHDRSSRPRDRSADATAVPCRAVTV